ncbi:hypothetical protein ACQPXM_24480 [Kribbella sp. CA-253562]|uniref:hypothetical protein n=1 Tax=Kribbella sp. CA-253562 TaxID=3239942 RepID=UPI003D9319A9
MVEQQINPYDQQTLDHLAAAGVDSALIERVQRLAKDAAAWRARATEQRVSPEDVVIPPPHCIHDTGSTQYWIWPFHIGD